MRVPFACVCVCVRETVFTTSGMKHVARTWSKIVFENVETFIPNFYVVSNVTIMARAWPVFCSIHSRPLWLFPERSKRKRKFRIQALKFHTQNVKI